MVTKDIQTDNSQSIIAEHVYPYYTQGILIVSVFPVFLSIPLNNAAFSQLSDFFIGV